MLKKILAMGFITVLLSSFMLIPVNATEYSGSGDVFAKIDGSELRLSDSLPMQKVLFSSSGSQITSLNAILPRTPKFDGILNIYFSFYAGSDTGEVTSRVTTSTYQVGYASDMSTQIQFADTPSVSYFSPSGIFAYNGYGAMVRARLSGSEGEPIYLARVLVDNSNGIFSGPSDMVLCVQNFSAVYTASSAEAEILESVADQVSQIYNIQIQYYPQVISKVDQIYQEIGTTNNLLEESIQQFEDWNIVSSVPGSVTDKTDQAEDVLDELHQLEKPEPDQIVPELDTDTTEIAQILEPYFQNTLILQILMMTLGFAFVSYVLFGKKG